MYNMYFVGRRVCVGESLAKMELILFIVTLVQHFSLSLPEGASLPATVGKLGATHTPPRYQVIFTPRS